MTDFLDRLAARAIGDAPMLAPRLPAWFEPPARGPQEPSTGDPAWVAETHADRSRPPGSAAPSDAPRRVRVPATSPGPTPVESASGRSAPDRPVAAAHVATAATPAVPRARIKAPDLIRVHRSERAPASVHTGAVGPTAPPLRQAPSPEEIRTATRPATVTRGALQPPSMSVFASSPAARPASETARVTPRQRATTAPAHARPPSESAVHVTIGRLEVRAAPAPAPPSRRGNALRPSSLDDYLRQRNGRPPA